MTATIDFSAQLYTLEDETILRLPEKQSKELPSRGQVAVTATINGHEFQTVVEPDGNWGHWIRVTKSMQNDTGVSAGDVVTITLEPTKKWPEPDVPNDIAKALATSPDKVKEKWKDITAMARWEWIRWVNSTGNTDTRAIRIEKTISKLNGTHRRPCCFNLAACTDPKLSKSGRLKEPAAA